MKVVLRKTRAGSKTVDTILTAAVKEFADHGFDGARMDRIAKKAGVNKATIYYHIGDKAALYRDVLTNILSRISDELDDKIEKAENPEDKLRAYICAIAKNITSSREFSPIMLREIAQGGENLPMEVAGRMKSIVSKLRSILEEGAKTNIFRKTDPALTHLLIAGGINFYVAGAPVRQKMWPGGEDDDNKPSYDSYDNLGDRVAEIVLNGLTIR